MNINPFVFLLIIITGVGLFVGLILLGPGSGETPVVKPLVTPQVSSRVSDEFGVARPAPAPDRAQPERLGETTAPQKSILAAEEALSALHDGQSLAVEKTILPLPLFPSLVRPSAVIPRANQPIPQAAHFFRTAAPPAPRPTPSPSGGRPQTASPTSARQSSSADALESFSVFDHTPELRDFRQQMVEAGVIKEDEFARINNNNDMEQFMLKFVTWQAEKASSTPEQIQDARGRISKAYAGMRSGIPQQ